jgi:spermidine/putrescine ABC transporter ATP-binding subunit
MDTDTAFIRIDKVSKHFSLVKAVDEVSIDVRRGEFFSLLGASGCGKTTLLRVLAGFEYPTAGEVFIDGTPMSDVPPHRRPTNMVFQSYAIFPHLDVRANVAYGLRKEKLGKDELAARVEGALRMVKLSGLEGRRATELSGGQRQRVALARALVKRPKVLLLDEPLGALDKKLREDMQLELRALQKSLGITFVFVTHDQEEALTMSDRIAVMSEGKVLQIASPKELYEKPVNVEVADFIGQMNFFDARVAELKGDRADIEAAGIGRFDCPAPERALHAGEDLVVAIRPEKLHLSRTEPAAGLRRIQGRIHAEAYLGDRSHFYVDIDGLERPVAVAEQNIEEDLADATGKDAQVWLSWRDTSVVLLPRDEPAVANE